MKKEKQLTAIQWQFVRQFSQVASISALIGMTMIFTIWKLLTTSSIWEGIHIIETMDIPMFPGLVFIIISYMTAIGSSILIGAVWGYIQGNLFKKRLEVLLLATLKLERGSLSTRVPALGEDEIGRLGEQINGMTERFQKQVNSLQKLSSDNAELAEKVKGTAITEERQRLARELHDAVSQQLFAISMTMSAVRRIISKDPTKAEKQAQMVEEMAASAQSEMRALLLHLRPARLDGKSLKQGIEELLNEFQSKDIIEFTSRIDHLPDISKGIEDHLFRILQEALSNTLRHAKAHKVEVFITSIEDQIRLKIVDDGIGFDEVKSGKATSYGLVVMKERAAEIGGVLNISTAPGQGTMIEVNVPLMTR